MIYSWLLALTYAICYTLIIVFVKMKAEKQLNEKNRRSSIANSLVNNAQNISPKQTTIDEDNATDNAMQSAQSKKPKHRKQQSSQTIDLTTLHEIQHTSLPFGSPVSRFEAAVAVFHSFDSGLHFGLLLDMYENSYRWNLAEQYLFMAFFILIVYRFISFATVFLYLPRYSYSKKASTSAAVLKNYDEKQRSKNNNDIRNGNNNNNNNNGNVGGGSSHHNTQDSQVLKLELLQASKKGCQCPSFCSYSYLQFFFDFGYIIELAPWLWNWEQSRIILSEFAWFCKMRSLLESLPFSVLICTFLLSLRENNGLLASDLQIYAVVSLCVSLFTIILSLFLYDNRTLNTNFENEIPNERLNDMSDADIERYNARQTRLLFGCNYVYRYASVISRVLILSFLIALFPWPFLIGIVVIPVVSYSGPYKLGNTDAEPLNLFFQSLLVFPEYSSPFGKILDSENVFNNKLHPLHTTVVIVLGFPLLIILIVVEKVVNKLLKIKGNNKIFAGAGSDADKEKYASFRITTYTLSRFVESILELIVIAVELFDGREVKQAYVDYNSTLVLALFYIAVGATVVFPCAFIKLHDQFVVDNEEDFDLSYAESRTPQAAHADYVVSNDQYNQHHGYVGTGNISNNNSNNNNIKNTMTSFHVDSQSGHINVEPLYDSHGSRQYLRQKQYWIGVHRNNYKELAWLLRSRQHINILEVNDQEQIGLTIVGIRHDWECMQLLIEHGGGVQHLVRYACLKGELEILRYVQHQLHIDMSAMIDVYDEPMVFSAIEGEQASVVQFFADIGANLNVKTVQGDSASIIAAKKGNMDIIKILGDANVDLTDIDDQGNTIAHYAAESYPGLEILRYLKQKYIDEPALASPRTHTNTNTNTNASAKKQSLMNGNIKSSKHKPKIKGVHKKNNPSKEETEETKEEEEEKVEVEKDGRRNNNTNNTDDKNTSAHNKLQRDCAFDFNHRNLRGMSAAYICSFQGQISNLRVLIECGADLNLTNKDGNNCVMAAAMNAQASTLDFLLENMNMDVDYANPSLETSAFWAASNGSVGCLDVLIEQHASLEKCDKYGISPLMVAAEHGEEAAVACLLKGGANVNHQNQDGETALMKACAEGYLSCVKLLMGEANVDYRITDDEGNPAILWCCMTGNMDIFSYLVCDVLNLSGEDILGTLNNDKESCVDWIVENQLEVGIDILTSLGVDLSRYDEAEAGADAANDETANDETGDKDGDDDEDDGIDEDYEMHFDEDDDVDLMAI